MKLVSINIEGNLHTDTVTTFLEKEKPDIVCMQELLEEDVEYYTNLLGFTSVYEPWDAYAVGDYPGLDGKKNGVGVFAANMTDSGIVQYADKYAFAWADVPDSNGNTYKVITTHLPVTKKGAVTDFQLEAVNGLLEALEQIPAFILCGDTNAPRGREAFELIAAKYKDNIPPHYTTSIDQNLHKVKGIQFMVDALFTTPEYVAQDVQLVDGVSDHMAVVANISKA